MSVATADFSTPVESLPQEPEQVDVHKEGEKVIDSSWPWKTAIIVFIAVVLVSLLPMRLLMTPFQSVLFYQNMPDVFHALLTGLLTVILVFFLGGF